MSKCEFDLPGCNCGPRTFECVDCNQTVKNTPDWEALHNCPADRGNIKRIGMIIGLVLASITIMILAFIGGLIVIDKVFNPAEDSGSLGLNCHIYGDGKCGPDAPWHGFVNI